MSDIVLSKFSLSCYNCIWIHNCNYTPLHYYYHIVMYTVKILLTIRINTVLCSICYIDSNRLWAQFYEYQINQSQDMLANITSVENLVRQLKDLEKTITEVQTTNKIVSILPSQFQHFRVVWDTHKESEQTMELLTLRLLAEERRMYNSQETRQRIVIRIHRNPT